MTHGNGEVVLRIWRMPLGCAGPVASTAPPRPGLWHPDEESWSRSHRQESDVVPLDVRVVTGESQSFALRLGHQHAIEGVPVDERQSAGSHRVAKCDG